MIRGPVNACALWLVPGADHPVFVRYARFFASLFGRFEALDYRHAYLSGGAAGVEEAIALAVRRVEPQLILYTQFPSAFSYIAPAFLARLRSTARVVALGFDDEIYFDQAKYFYEQCDAVITSDLAGADHLRSLGIPTHLAQLQQPQEPADRAPLAKDIAVSFVGDLTKPDRRRYIDALESAGIAVSDYGKGSRNGRLSDETVRDVFRRSRINLNFTRTNPPSWVVRHDAERAQARQIKGRPFEIAALGGFCLCEWAPCVETWFVPGKEIGVFRDEVDLVEQAKRYLDDDALRERIAAAANSRYRASYVPEFQYQRIFSQILSSPRPAHRPAGLPAAPIFHESIGRSRSVAFLYALRSARFARALREALAGRANTLDYWRGFMGGMKDSVAARLRRS